ncbi:hypothetical protein KQX54_008099 [Cotesia glomerata]|uniref:Uncharacterized protein n=1 Tax=Cotesia glomerata TaxID=32391 RepID=A0AAV7J5Q0_COTGL|nr:hypothetical protein KQX54_008099 [Cotesia glomerata]
MDNDGQNTCVLYSNSGSSSSRCPKGVEDESNTAGTSPAPLVLDSILLLSLLVGLSSGLNPQPSTLNTTIPGTRATPHTLFPGVFDNSIATRPASSLSISPWCFQLIPLFRYWYSQVTTVTMHQ